MDVKFDKISKVMLVAGWIPVDAGTFGSFAWPSLADESCGQFEPGFTFQSEGEVIQGPWAAIQAVKYA